MPAPLDAAALARPVRLGEVRPVPPVATVVESRPPRDVARRFTNGVDTVEISRAALVAYAAARADRRAWTYAPLRLAGGPAGTALPK